MKQGIIFDMDGTLWDSAENVAESWNLAIRESGLSREKLTGADIQGVMGKTMDVIADLLFPDLNEAERSVLLERCCERENDYLRRHGGVLYEGVRETFANLRQKGYGVYIVSNCQKGYIEAFLDFYGLWDEVCDIECYGNNLKPKGDNIRLVVERNGLAQAVYVGDIQGDYEASVSAGIGFIHAAYGFGTVDADVPRIGALTELTDFPAEALFSSAGQIFIERTEQKGGMI